MTETARGHLAMLLFSALVAGSFTLGSLAANELDPTVLNAARFILAMCIVGAVALATTGINREAFRAPWRYLLLGGLFASYFVLMFEGLKTAPPVSAAAVFTLVPVMAAVFGWLLLRQAITGRIVLALSIGAVGALWVIFRGDPRLALSLDVGRGEAVYFVGCVAHAAYTPLVRKLNRGEPAVVFTFGMLVAGAVLLTVIAWPGIVATQWGELPTIVWITIGYTAVFASAATFVLMQYATMRLPSANVMAYTYLTPGWVIVWEAVRTGQLPPPWISGGILLTGIALFMLLTKKNTAARENKSKVAVSR
ncbi:DMT family transporter [Oceaniovalibus sp. ACAM 378]|uniref:DMT family transporter n=1 Tax=Oceaniovalibus sp. ACAM 378 TaxID=2599923 RepID=UPI0011D67AB7|nr:DMT family transporter [Oceaniovalibus sp. ACAM 378]TYB90622.1 DMT family transporter [Oceaniovalibus sp. ACAM 378]